MLLSGFRGARSVCSACSLAAACSSGIAAAGVISSADNPKASFSTMFTRGGGAGCTRGPPPFRPKTNHDRILRINPVRTLHTINRDVISRGPSRRGAGRPHPTVWVAESRLSSRPTAGGAHIFFLAAARNNRSGGGPIAFLDPGGISPTAVSIITSISVHRSLHGRRRRNKHRASCTPVGATASVDSAASVLRGRRSTSHFLTLSHLDSYPLGGPHLVIPESVGPRATAVLGTASLSANTIAASGGTDNHGIAIRGVLYRATSLFDRLGPSPRSPSIAHAVMLRRLLLDAVALVGSSAMDTSADTL